MHVSCSRGGIGLTVALALLGLAVPVSADQANNFRASGTYTVTAVQGAHFELTLSGRARPGGRFAGTFSGKAVDHGNTQYGELTFDFGDGTLTCDVVVERQADGTLSGNWEVVDSTGVWAGIRGGGSCSFEGATPGGTAQFEFNGTLSP